MIPPEKTREKMPVNNVGRSGLIGLFEPSLESVLSMSPSD